MRLMPTTARRYQLPSPDTIESKPAGWLSRAKFLHPSARDDTYRLASRRYKMPDIVSCPKSSTGHAIAETYDTRRRTPAERDDFSAF